MRKLWKVDLPDFDQMLKETRMSPDEARSKLKEKGVAPPNPYNEREMYNPCSMGLIEPYEPPEGDGTTSSILDKLKSPLSSGKDLVKNRRTLSAIRNYEGEDFDLQKFAKESVEIYVKAHEALAEKDEQKMFEYVTEYCFPIMSGGLDYHTIIWNYMGEISEPVVVQARAGELISAVNKFSQLTVRMHSKQILAVYDRHGRLVHGSPTDVREVFEYIVYEKFLADEYGRWRLHGRIRPPEMSRPFSQQVSKTFRVQESSAQ